jgi:hypothetical protein
MQFLIKDLDFGFLVQGTQDEERARKVLGLARPSGDYEIVATHHGYFRSPKDDHSLFSVNRARKDYPGVHPSVLFHTVPKDPS